MRTLGEHIDAHTDQFATGALAEQQDGIFHRVFRISPNARAYTTDSLRALLHPLQAGPQTVGGICTAIDANLPVIAPGWLALFGVMQHREFVDILAIGIIDF